MSVILAILKILGIIIAVIIGIVLLAVALVLFLPVRYRANGSIEEEKRVEAELYWLLHVLSFRIAYAGERTDTSFKIFGFTKKKKDVPSIRHEEDETATQECASEAEKESGASIPTEGPGKQEKDSQTVVRAEGARKQAEDSDTIERSNPSKEAVTADLSIAEIPLSEESGESGQSQQIISGKAERTRRNILKEVIEKIRSWKQKFLQMIQNILQFRQKAGEIWHTIVTDSNRKAVSYIGKEVIYLMRHLRFRRWKTSVVFSLGDPALTGQVLGGLATLPFLYQKDVHIYPDFEAETAYLRGDFTVRGHLRLIHVLCSFFRLVCKKECRKLFGYIMK